MCDEPPPSAGVHHDHPDWQDGDFTLISSDGWRFRVSSEVLFAASEVLSDAPVTGAQEFQFPDPELECAAVIEQFLLLATHGIVDRSRLGIGPSAPQTAVPSAYEHVIRFLRKYDCEPTLEALRAALIRGGFWGWEVFGIGALADDDGVCCASLEVPAGLDQHGRTVRYLSWEHLPETLMSEVGPRYRYALHRFERQVADWFEVGPMPVKVFFNSALAEFDNLKEHPDWRFGEITLVSSDKWRFQVPSHVLQRAGFLGLEPSQGFGLSQGEEPGVQVLGSLIVFACWKMEKARVLEQFLSLVADGKLRPPQGKEWHDCGILRGPVVDTYLNTLTMLQKHCCLKAIEAFGAEIVKLMVYGVMAPHVGFGFGLLAEDKSVCASSVCASSVCASSVSFFDPELGHFVGREVLPAFLEWRAWEPDNALLMALDHVQKFVNGPGRTYYGYVAWKDRQDRQADNHSRAWGKAPVSDTRPDREWQELTEFWGCEDDDGDIVNWGRRRDLKGVPFKRHLAQRFLSYVAKVEQGTAAEHYASNRRY